MSDLAAELGAGANGRIPERYKRDFEDAAGWHNGSYIQQLHREIGRAEAALQELVGHVNSLPEGHYSAWLSWWAKEAAAETEGSR
jgi:hypothetical protein